MKYILNLSIFCPLWILGQTDISGVVLNNNKEALPFTNIALLNRNNGTMTNESGQFILSNIRLGDSIKISNITYFSKVININELKNNDTIILNENIKQMEDVVVSNFSIFKQEADVGFYNYSSNGSFQLGPGNQLATFIANTRNEEAWIKEVSFKVKEYGKCNNGFRIRLLRSDTTKLQPLLDILDENIIITADDLKKTNYIDLSSYKVIFPREGIFILIEWLSADPNCDKHAYTSISANLEIPDNLVWYNYRDKLWSRNHTPRQDNGNYMTPNIGLKVFY